MKKLLLFVVVAALSITLGYQVNMRYYYEKDPVQPINFSHKIHAGDHKIDCKYCHIFVERSRVAGVPNVKRCMGCHSVIKTDSPEIIKLTGYWERKEEIPWVRVHNLPDFVYFPHKRHVRAGVKCQQCHGDVANMPRVTRVASLQMGWCLECHTTGAIDIIGHPVKNGRDCWTCHK